MERHIFDRKTVNNQCPRVDRFIFPRERIYDLKRRPNLHNSAANSQFDIWHKKYKQHKKFVNRIDDAFGIKNMTWGPSTTPTDSGWIQSWWPCVPRRKTYLSSADSILDLPTYSHAVFPELLDWSNDNILVAALGSNYHKWSWRSQSLISQGYTNFDIQCCKFDPRGELLILGTEVGKIEIHDNETNKQLRASLCYCLCDTENYCSITAIDCSPTGNSYVSGCARGIIMGYSRDATAIRSHRLPQRKPILSVRVSPDSRYVAANCFHSTTIYLLTWPGLILCSSVTSEWTTRSICWHPWRSALLAIGSVTSDMQTSLALWDTPRCKIRESELKHKSLITDSMLFSHKSGELVLSLWNVERSGTHPHARSQLVVMSNPDTVVDQWGSGRSGLDRVRTMVFSPDGTKLATATSDEDLIIWNFLPEDKIKKKKKNRSFSAMPVYMDEVSTGYSVR